MNPAENKYHLENVAPFEMGLWILLLVWFPSGLRISQIDVGASCIFLLISAGIFLRKTRLRHQGSIINAFLWDFSIYIIIISLLRLIRTAISINAVIPGFFTYEEFSRYTDFYCYGVALLSLSRMVPPEFMGFNKKREHVIQSILPLCVAIVLLIYQVKTGFEMLLQ